MSIQRRSSGRLGTPGCYILTLAIVLTTLPLHPLRAGLPDCSSLPPVTDFLTIERMTPQGQTYLDDVPDTLDLAERARLSIHGLTQNRIDPTDNAYELLIYHSYYFGLNPPSEENALGYTFKYARALPKLRAMCGSREGLDAEIDSMRIWLDISQFRCVIDDYMDVGAHGISLALYNWYARDPDPGILAWTQAFAHAIADSAVVVPDAVNGDRAFYPPESGFQNGQWIYFPPTAFVPYTPPDEPFIDQVGNEGTSKWMQAFALRALVRNYVENGDVSVLPKAAEIVRFMTQPRLWDMAPTVQVQQPEFALYNYTPDYSEYGFTPQFPGHENGIWSGHGHGGLTGLQALLNYAIVVDDDDLKELVRKSWEHWKRIGVAKLGWLPFWFPREAWNRIGFSVFTDASEAGATGDLVVLAMTMTDAGIGDYWDEIDHIVRNMLAEQQITDLSLLQQVSGGNSALLEKYLGCSIAACRPTWAEALTWGDSTANMAIGYYYAWHGITRFDDGVATVNLLLNRAAGWLDVYSHLPYEGKVEIRNKLAHTLRLRIPGWADINQVTVEVNDAPVSTERDGRYLIIKNLARGDLIRFEFDLPVTVEQFTLGPAGSQVTYTMTLKGSTVVDLSPKHDDPVFDGVVTFWDYHTDKRVPLFRRSPNDFAGPAPTRQVERFVAERIIPLQGRPAPCLPAVSPADRSGDCRVTLLDYATFTQGWMYCTHPDCD